MKTKIPGAKLGFKVDEKIQALLDPIVSLPLEDNYARQEWGWKPKYDLNRIVDDFLAGAARSNVTPSGDMGA